jgi:hypothetical protein
MTASGWPDGDWWLCLGHQRAAHPRVGSPLHQLLFPRLWEVPRPHPYEERLGPSRPGAAQRGPGGGPRLHGTAEALRAVA